MSYSARLFNAIKVTELQSRLVLITFLSTILLLSYSISEKSNAFAVNEKIFVNDPRFIKNPSSKLRAFYKISNNGLIIDGPRIGKNGPIDYSALLNNREIYQTFKKTMFACNVRQIDCNNKIATISRWETNKLSVWGHVSSSEKSTQFLNKLGGKFENVLSIAGISLRYVKSPKFADIFIFVGNRKFLKKMNTTLMKDPYFKEFLKKPFGKTRKYQLLNSSSAQKEIGLCASSPAVSRLKHNINVAKYIFSKKGIDECAMTIILLSVGYWEKFDVFSSASSNVSSAELTGQDRILLKLLYDKKIKSGMNRDQAMPIIKILLQNTRPHGEE